MRRAGRQRCGSSSTNPLFSDNGFITWGRMLASVQFPPPKCPPREVMELQTACCCALHPPFRVEGRRHGFLKEYILLSTELRISTPVIWSSCPMPTIPWTRSSHLGREQRRVDCTLWTPPSSNTFFQQLFQCLLHFQSQIIQPCLKMNGESNT